MSAPGRRERMAASLEVVRSAWSSTVLRRLVGAYALFEVAEYAIWMSLLINAYRHGGATASLLIALVQLLPSILLAPAIGALADRKAPERVLTASYGLLALTAGALAAAVAAGARPWVVFVLAPLTTLSLTAARPAQAAVMPAVVRTPDELTASNVLGGWADGVANIAGPALAGVLVALQGAGLAIGAGAGMMLGSTWLTVAALRRAPLVAAAQSNRGSTEGAGLPGTLAAILAGVRRNLAVVRRSRPTLVLLGLQGFSYLIVGAVELLSVVLAPRLLHLGSGGAGYLTAALGAGSILAGGFTVTLIGRARLAGVLAASLIAAGAALALLGLFPEVGDAFVLLGAVGLAGSVFDVSGRTLLQRAAPANAIAGGFSLLESLLNVGLAAGALLARVGLAIAGPRAALVMLAVLAVVLVAWCWRPLRALDDAATVPQVEIRLLHSIPIFAALPAPALEGVARELDSLHVAAGTAVIVEGEPSDRYYAIADGRFEVTRQGCHVATLSRGNGFGEIALVRDVPRTASVTALDDAMLFSLGKAAFQLVLTGHAPARRAAEGVVAGRLPPAVEP